MDSSSAAGPGLRAPIHLSAHTWPNFQSRLYGTKAPEYGRQSSKPKPSYTEKDQAVASLPSTSDVDLPHLTLSQTVHMTQIDKKLITKRLATATCIVFFSNSTPYQLLGSGGRVKKGDAFSVARIAGIMAAKKTADIIPLCHPGIGITGVEVDLKLQPSPSSDKAGHGFVHGSIRIISTVTCLGRTGVEMEALTATMAAALTIYDMCKAVDKGMVISEARVIEKLGGMSGHWVDGKKHDKESNDEGTSTDNNIHDPA
jgi:GTP 3',8-cyclase